MVLWAVESVPPTLTLLCAFLLQLSWLQISTPDCSIKTYLSCVPSPQCSFSSFLLLSHLFLW